MPNIKIGDIVRISRNPSNYTHTDVGSIGTVVKISNTTPQIYARWSYLTGNSPITPSLMDSDQSEEWRISISCIEVIVSVSKQQIICDKILEMRDKRKKLGYKY